MGIQDLIVLASHNYSGKLSGCRPQCFHWGHTCRPRAYIVYTGYARKYSYSYTRPVYMYIYMQLVLARIIVSVHGIRPVDFTKRFSITGLTTGAVQFLSPFLASLRDREQRQQVIFLISASS